MNAQVHLIYAKSKNNVIGNKGCIPWRLPEDFAHFKKCTLGKPVIMGRKTYESIGKPLPGRKNIVITRISSYNPHPAVVVCGSLEEALLMSGEGEGGGSVWVIGGSEIYKLAEPVAHSVVVTEVDIECEGDTFALDLDCEGVWKETSREKFVSKTGLGYSIVVYHRAK